MWRMIIIMLIFVSPIHLQAQYENLNIMNNAKKISDELPLYEVSIPRDKVLGNASTFDDVIYYNNNKLGLPDELGADIHILKRIGYGEMTTLCRKLDNSNSLIIIMTKKNENNIHVDFILVFNPDDIFTVSYIRMDTSYWGLTGKTIENFNVKKINNDIWEIVFPSGSSSNIKESFIYRDKYGLFVPEKKSYYYSLSANDNVNIRERPDKNSKILYVVKAHESLYNNYKLSDSPEIIDGVNDFWYLVSNGSISGWVFGKYIVAESIGK
jgi:hypothetical protein